MKTCLQIFLMMIVFQVNASQKAVTEQGDVVVLHEDGTWAYENKTEVTTQEIPVNSKSFTTPADSTFTLKSTRTDTAFKLDPKKWNFSKNDQGEAAEYNLKLKSGDLYAMAITEQIEIAVETLAEIAVDNARDAAADIRVTKKEYRNVNGLKVIYMEMEGTIQQVKFTYLGYYYSNDSGSIQYLAYTGSNLVHKYRQDIDQLLNGLVSQ